MTNLSQFAVGTNTTIRAVMSCIDRNARGVVLVTDGEDRLLATVTDGDLRRAILSAIKLEDTVAKLLALRGPRKPPVTAPTGTSEAALVALMKHHSVRQIPIVDESNRVCGMVTMDELVRQAELPMRAVVLAGGYGTRLRPLTESTPKPMLPVGDSPLMQHTIEQLRDVGIRRINVCTHYRAEQIIEHFGNGSAFGVDLQYVSEETPLGTAGALSLFEGDEPMLVINGDILTRVDYRSMIHFHDEQEGDMTMGIRQYDIPVPYGVVDCEGARVMALKEKPLLQLFVNAGIYVISPAARRYVPSGERFDMTDLIQVLLSAGRKVASFPIWEYWIDIGQRADYEQAQSDAAAAAVRT
jgi:dTDP-glucose pyrophosphorylase